MNMEAEHLNQLIVNAFYTLNKLDMDRGVFDRKNQSQQFINFLIKSECIIDDIMNYLNEYKEIIENLQKKEI